MEIILRCFLQWRNLGFTEVDPNRDARPPAARAQIGQSCRDHFRAVVIEPEPINQSLLARIAKDARFRITRLRFHRDQFFDIADHILQDVMVDEGTLIGIKAMTEDMDQAKVFRKTMKAVVEIDKEIRSGTFRPRSAPVRPPEWGRLVYHYLFAVSYSRAVQGRALREMLASLLDPRVVEQCADSIDRRVHPLQFQPA